MIFLNADKVLMQIARHNIKVQENTAKSYRPAIALQPAIVTHRLRKKSSGRDETRSFSFIMCSFASAYSSSSSACLMTACAAARRATGTLYGEQDT